MTRLDLFAQAQPEPGPTGAALGQFFTPTWAAEALVQHFYPCLGPADFVVEPTCGPGAFLGAVPDHVPALGIEIDAALACQARAATGRAVLVGDIRTIDIPGRPTLFLGNPPFDADLIAALLGRAHDAMAEGGRVGLILPAYVFQAPRAVLGFARRWTMAQDMVPRTLFPGLSMPLCFARFTRNRQPVIQGFMLYAEAAAVAQMPPAYRAVLNRAPRSAWVRCVADALRRLGGTATLDQLYREIGGARPSTTPWWREKVRQVAQQHLRRVAPATYAVAA